MQKGTEEKTIQALASVASLAGLSLKKATTGDDLKEFTLTLAFTGVSAGLVQERFDFERVDTRHTVNGRGEVEHVDTGDPDDWKETAAASIEKELDAEASAKATVPAGDETEKVGEATDQPREGVEVPLGETATLGDEKPDIHLVGEAAAVARKRH